MIEQDSITGKHSISLPVIDNYPVCIQLGSSYKYRVRGEEEKEEKGREGRRGKRRKRERREGGRERGGS